MRSDLNPYEPPPGPKFVPLLWDRAVLAQLMVAIHVFCFVACGSTTLLVANSSYLVSLGFALRLRVVVGICSLVGLLVVTMSIMTKGDWPIRFRLWFVAVDALIVGLTAIAANGFGILW